MLKVQVITDKAETSQDTSSSLALTMMKQELPQFIQHMSEAVGYKILQTIADMDATSESNDIDRMLDYVYQANFSKNARLVIIMLFLLTINVSL